MKLLLDHLAFPEGPRWHEGRLWFSDMHAHEIVAMDEAGARETMLSWRGPTSGLGWLPDGRLLAGAAVYSLVRMRAQLGQVETRQAEIAAQIAAGGDPLAELEALRQSSLNQRLLVDKQLVEARKALEERDAEMRALESERNAIVEALTERREHLANLRLSDQEHRLQAQALADAIIEAGFEIDALLADATPTEAEPAAQDDADADEPDTTDDVPDKPVVAVSREGDVWAIGSHRLICGDATDPAVVATLMQGDTAQLCFTSPPYGNQRDYTSGGIADWDVLMRGVFAHLPMAGDGQVLVNLGLIHRDNEVIPYWDGWLSWMRQLGWRRFAWYVWDQGPGMPGDWQGRLAPSFEFVFHFNRSTRKPNKIVPCKHAGQESHLRADGSSTAMRGKDGEVGGWTHKGQPTQDTRIPDSVIRVMRHKGKIGQDIDHPAVFPVALPEFAIESYTDAGDIVFEPFGGSGTTMLAAQRTGRICRSVEIAPEYVDVAIKRFQQNHPGVPVTLIATGQSFDEIATEREMEVAA